MRRVAMTSIVTSPRLLWLQVDEGCKTHGYLEVSKVAGNFHFAPGKSFQSHSVHGELGGGERERGEGVWGGGRGEGMAPAH